MNLENIRRDDWILAAVAIVLIITLFAFPWFSITGNIGLLSVTFTATGTDGPDGWTAILAVIALLMLVADIGVERLAPDVTVPAIGDSRATTRFVLACVAAGFIALKFLLHIHFSLFGWGFYLAVILTIALVYLAAQARRAPAVAAAGPPMGSAGPPSAGPPAG
jgi:hypothetical protein